MGCLSRQHGCTVAGVHRRDGGMLGAFDRRPASAAQVVFEMERREAIGVRRHEKDTRRMPVASVGLYRLTRYTIKTVKVSGYGSFGRLIRSGKWQIAPVRSCRNACTVTSRWNCCQRGVDSILRWRRDSASTNSHLAVNYLAVHGISLAFQKKKVARCRLAPEPKKDCA